MFCKYCGCKLDDATTVCTSCGKTLDASIHPAANETEQFVQDNDLQEASETADEITQNDSPCAENEEFHLRVVEEMPAVTTKKKSKTPGITILILLVLCIAIGGGYYAYINSDEYKTEQAQMYFNQQDYDRAEQYLTDVNTPQANELRNQIAIERALLLINSASLSEAAELLYSVNTPQAQAILSFISLESTKIAYMDSYAEKPLSKDMAKYNEFKQALSNFEKQQVEYYLPETLLATFRKYKSAFAQAEAFFHSFSDMMRICALIITEKTSHEDRTFSPSSWPSAIAAEKKALQEVLTITNDDSFDLLLVDGDLDTAGLPYETINGKHYIYLSNALSRELHNLYVLMESKLEYCEEEYADMVEEFGEDSDLYITNTQPNYKVPLNSSILVDIGDYADYTTNEGALYCMVKRDMIYYFLSGGKHK